MDALDLFELLVQDEEKGKEMYSIFCNDAKERGRGSK